MGTKHPHYDVIVAWASGEEIEFRGGDFVNWQSWENEYTPSFYASHEWRIKPKRIKKEGWVNVYPAYCGSVHRTENEANKSALGTRVACIRIEWEEESV